MRIAAAIAVFALALASAPAGAQQYQVDDSTYVPRVARPTFTDHHPVVLMDQAHFNHFTMDGRYRAFATLLRADGFRLAPAAQRLSTPLLKGAQVLVIADALAGPNPIEGKSAGPAFTSPELDALCDWLRQGGSLLLIADHAPFASSVDSLALRLGVDQSKGFTMDERRLDPEIGNPGCLLFERSRGMIPNHPITRGHDKSERIDRVATYTGQSLMGPPGSTGFLRLAETARDLSLTAGGRSGPASGTGEVHNVQEMLDRDTAPAGGRAQGVALTYGKGRVVVMGEAAMFGAQLVLGLPAHRLNKEHLKIGLNRPDLQNGQLALNILHWLAHDLN